MPFVNVEIENGPHKIGWTRAEEINAAMLEFLTDEAIAGSAPVASASLAAGTAPDARFRDGGER